MVGIEQMTFTEYTATQVAEMFNVTTENSVRNWVTRGKRTQSGDRAFLARKKNGRFSAEAIADFKAKLRL